MPNLLSVDTVLFTVLGYPMSYIEFAGTVLYLCSVWLIVKRNVFTWPVGMVRSFRVEKGRIATVGLVFEQ